MKPHGYILVEQDTGARDGVYFEKKDAIRLKDFHQSVWKGSTWTIIAAFKGDSVRGRFHRDDPMRSRLINKYGEPNYD